MQRLDLVGYTADLTHLVLHDTTTGERFTVALSSELVGTVAEVLEVLDPDARRALLPDGAGLAAPTAAGPTASEAATTEATAPWEPAGPDAPSPAAALVALGQAAPSRRARAKVDGTGSRLTPSEIQRMLRSGKSPESVAEQAAVSLDWVLRWFQPIEAEQQKVITSVRGGRQEREGFGPSDDLIGAAVRTNLLTRGIEPEDGHVQWTAARPEGRPYWTITLRFTENGRVQRATWRYDIGTGRVTPRDDLATDLGWTAPITHPAPGRMHHGTGEDAPLPPPKASPPPPPVRAPARWAPPAPPSPRRTR